MTNGHFDVHRDFSQTTMFTMYYLGKTDYTNWLLWYKYKDVSVLQNPIIVFSILTSVYKQSLQLEFVVYGCILLLYIYWLKHFILKINCIEIKLRWPISAVNFQFLCKRSPCILSYLSFLISLKLFLPFRFSTMTDIGHQVLFLMEETCIFPLSSFHLIVSF